MGAVDLEIRNYRGFTDSAPARWRLEDGFVGFIGANNAGKSSLLRFFHEARPSLSLVDPQNAMAQGALGGQPLGVSFQSVADPREVFSNENDRDMTLKLMLSERPAGLEARGVEISWRRSDLAVEVRYEWADHMLAGRYEGDSVVVVLNGNELRLDVRRVIREMHDLVNSLYLGPFRNAVNVGGSSSYYDLNIGQQFIAQWNEDKTGANRDRNRAATRVEHELRHILGSTHFRLMQHPTIKPSTS